MLENGVQFVAYLLGATPAVVGTHALCAQFYEVTIAASTFSEPRNHLVRPYVALHRAIDAVRCVHRTLPIASATLHACMSWVPATMLSTVSAKRRVVVSNGH